MRLVAWNCNQAFDRKITCLLELKPDIAIVPECADLDVLRSKAPLFIPDQAVWFGDNKQKGLGIFAFNGFELAIDQGYHPGNPIVVPILVSGPAAFNLLAVWSFNRRDNRSSKDHPGYSKDRPGPVLRALNDYSEFCRDMPLVVAGDFNNHVRWDKPGKANNQSNINQALGELGLVSAYHTNRGIEHGSETEPTHYWRDRKKDGPRYHIDYIFLPGAWAERIVEMYVGTFEQWCGRGLSDHVPLAVELNI